MKWRDKLNKQQRAHLKEVGIVRLSDVKKTRDWQREMARRTGIDKEVCLQCEGIAMTLGIE